MPIFASAAGVLPANDSIEFEMFTPFTCKLRRVKEDPKVVVFIAALTSLDGVPVGRSPNIIMLYRTNVVYADDNVRTYNFMVSCVSPHVMPIRAHANTPIMRSRAHACILHTLPSIGFLLLRRIQFIVFVYVCVRLLTRAYGQAYNGGY